MNMAEGGLRWLMSPRCLSQLLLKVCLSCLNKYTAAIAAKKVAWLKVVECKDRCGFG